MATRTLTGAALYANGTYLKLTNVSPMKTFDTDWKNLRFLLP